MNTDVVTIRSDVSVDVVLRYLRAFGLASSAACPFDESAAWLDVSASLFEVLSSSLDLTVSLAGSITGELQAKANKLINRR